MENYRDNLHVLTKNYDVCVIGATNVGKTSLINRYIYGIFDENLKLDNEEIYIKQDYDLKNNKIKQSIIYDSDFHEDMYLNSKKISILNASRLMFLYSIDNLESFEMIEEFLNFIKTFYKGNNDEEEVKLKEDNYGEKIPPFILVGSKSDLERERVIEYEQGEEMCKKLGGLAFFETSSKLNVGINECFNEILNLNENENNKKHSDFKSSNEEELTNTMRNTDSNSISNYESSIINPNKSNKTPSTSQEINLNDDNKQEAMATTTIQQPRPKLTLSNPSLVRLSTTLQNYQKHLSETSTLANFPIPNYIDDSISEKKISSGKIRSNQYENTIEKYGKRTKQKERTSKKGCCIIT
ncbi:uncharacterized protein KGF55_000300 [Candida pseudojiufengensis]|uniref:uncharacterized protein n=1 Tax=Candida pseudojiufengensis TaxID=497109 RepID=UPI002223F90B|nr:uncharacterized protein KGF55_000300 [Candida pseudojiufengensis]KAI5966891.1 hypothetical protein KGF55_000300 [Candida pseudojiufengensis]